MRKHTYAFEVTPSKEDTQSISAEVITQMLAYASEKVGDVSTNLSRHGSEKDVHLFEVELEARNDVLLNRFNRAMIEYIGQHGAEHGIKQTEVPKTFAEVNVQFGTSENAGKFYGIIATSLSAWAREYDVQVDNIRTNSGRSRNSMENWEISLTVSSPVSRKEELEGSLMDKFFETLERLAYNHSGEITNKEGQEKSFAARERKSSTPPPPTTRNK